MVAFYPWPVRIMWPAQQSSTIIINASESQSNHLTHGKNARNVGAFSPVAWVDPRNQQGFMVSGRLKHIEQWSLLLRYGYAIQTLYRRPTQKHVLYLTIYIWEMILFEAWNLVWACFASTGFSDLLSSSSFLPMVMETGLIFHISLSHQWLEELHFLHPLYPYIWAVSRCIFFLLSLKKSEAQVLFLVREMSHFFLVWSAYISLTRSSAMQRFP